MGVLSGWKIVVFIKLKQHADYSCIREQHNDNVLFLLDRSHQLVNLAS